MAELEVYDLERVNRFVLTKHHLTAGSRIDDILKVTEDIGGLHATHPMSPYLSLFARTQNFKRESLDAILYEQKMLGKVRYARKTVYVIPWEWIPAVFSATRQMLEQRLGPYLEHLGLSRKDFAEIAGSVMKTVAGRRMTTQEIKKELHTGQNISAVVNLMCDQGLLIRGSPAKGWKSNLHTYHLFQEYFPGLDLNEEGEADAKKTLIRIYLASFGPVTVKDASWWTGFTRTEVKQVLKELQTEIMSIEISGLKEKYILLASDREWLESVKSPAKPQVNFLPLLDPYLMGYKERERYITQELYSKVFDRSGNATSSILCDGRIIGVWDFEEGKEPKVKIRLFEKKDSAVMKDITSGAENVGKFICGKEVRVQECRSMTPLTERPMGGFMSPLKGC